MAKPPTQITAPQQKRRVLFIVHHRPNRSPGQRFRFEQYYNYLEANGFSCEAHPLLTAEDDSLFYRPGHYGAKFLIFAKGFIKRAVDVLNASDYDLIFIFREAFFTGSTYFETLLSRTGRKIIFDFDDAIWLPNVSEANKRLAWLKNSEKTSELIAMADMIFAGNAYLANYARQYNSNVKIVPTTIDTEVYVPTPRTTDANRPICIGWSGSFSTIQHFEYAIPFLLKIKEKYGEKVQIKVIGDGNYRHEALGIQGLDWKKEDELQELNSFDIGIMPLPDDDWARGKCGLKGLQYMALAVPTIMSPVGVNSEIIQHGENGFLAATTNEWFTALSTLIEDPALRHKMGIASRQTVEQYYSVHAWQQRYVDYFNELLAQH